MGKLISQKEIADTLGVNPTHVSTALHSTKHAEKNGKAKLYHSREAWEAVERYFREKHDEFEQRASERLTMLAASANAARKHAEEDI